MTKPPKNPIQLFADETEVMTKLTLVNDLIEAANKISPIENFDELHLANLIAFSAASVRRAQILKQLTPCLPE